MNKIPDKRHRQGIKHLAGGKGTKLKLPCRESEAVKDILGMEKNNGGRIRGA
jgi:hypothetical protein